MAIYRGPGGSGDAINDASSEALLTVQAKNAALAAQEAAELAQTAAELAETNAETAETNAETAETNAETAATNAASSASAASTSASNASSSASAASTSASNASTSATNASNSASAASTSETNASNSASAASTSASNASTSATNASNSASAAATSATNAAASYDAFDDRYLGSKSSNPTVDNDGNALLAGALYYNTTAPEMRVYNGTSWTFIGSGASAGVESFNTRTGAVTLSSSDVTTALTYTPLAPSAIGTTVQAYDADLTTLGAGGSSARSFLGLAIGTDVQAYDAQLADIAGLTPTDNNFIVGNGTNFVTESGSTARTSLGLGSIATQDASNVTITGGSVSGITDLAIADGGTGASDTATARTNLGLAIGTNVQAWDADLDTWATKTAPSGTVVGTSDSQTLTNKTLTNPTINGFTGDTSVVNIGSGQVYKDTSGNVGIGTSSPNTKLEVVGAVRATNSGSSGYFYRGYRSGTTSAWYVYDSGTEVQMTVEQANPLLFGTSNTERMRITPAGGVSFGSSGTAYGTSGQVLQSNGDAAPTWVTAAGTPTTNTYDTGTAATWTKPSTANWVLIEIWGGGGSGGKGGSSGPAGGGGGGAYNSLLVKFADLQGTVTYTVGAGGASQTTGGAGGNAGGTSSVTMGTYAGGGDKTLSAFGGAGGLYRAEGGSGGGGGGIFSAGSGPVGGSPFGGGSVQDQPINESSYGGGAGGVYFNPGAGAVVFGSSSVYGGGGGGAGRDTTGSATLNAGGNSQYGGGGGGGASNTVTGGNAGTSIYGGNGSAGAFDANTSSNGTTPAGGSGGTEGGNSGAGGGGRVRFTYW